jgi:hypothetical protein
MNVKCITIRVSNVLQSAYIMYYRMVSRCDISSQVAKIVRTKGERIRASLLTSSSLYAIIASCDAPPIARTGKGKGYGWISEARTGSRFVLFV